MSFYFSAERLKRDFDKAFGAGKKKKATKKTTAKKKATKKKSS